MLASHADPEVSRLGSRLQGLAGELIGALDEPEEHITLAAGESPGPDTGRYLQVAAGCLYLGREGVALYELGPGNLWLGALVNGDSALTVTAEADTRLAAWSAERFLKQLAESPGALSAWTEWLQVQGALMLGLLAAPRAPSPAAGQGHEQYNDGDIIIRQGDRADYVFHMTSGSAEVLVDGVTVGEIGSGEIFVAMAALTHADRTATVRANGPCTVLKVPKAQFSELIRTNPATIHSLLVDMANSIVSLNEQLVRLRGSG